MAETLHPLAVLHAMRGEFDDARSLVREGNAIIEDLGRMYSAGSHHEALVEMLAGQPDVAEDRLRRAYETLDEMGEKTLLATTAAMLAQAIYAQDRPQEAWRFCEVSRGVAADEDLSAQVVGRGTSAKILARQGRGDEAEALAREASSSLRARLPHAPRSSVPRPRRGAAAEQARRGGGVRPPCGAGAVRTKGGHRLRGARPGAHRAVCSA